MALDLSSCTFLGPALPEPFVKLDLESELKKAKLLPRTRGDEGKALRKAWEAYRRKLRGLVSRGGSIRVFNQVIEPLIALLGYAETENADDVPTRLEPNKGEDGGSLLKTKDGKAQLRVWTTTFDDDLDAPAKRGRAYRYSHLRIAQRVLLAANERVGILTNGVHLRILISDPARPDSEVVIPIDPDWRRSRQVTDSLMLVLALCRPEGVAAVPDLVDKARLKQAKVTKELRVQARQAVQRFVQAVLDHPGNTEALAAVEDKAQLARDLWHEGLVTIYRLLFILKGEASDDPARVFSFASTTHWRKTFSPSMALAQYARAVLDDGAQTGSLLEHGLKALFRMFAAGLECTELHVSPLGGSLFGEDATPLLTRLHWGERACAHLLDRLLWTPKRKGKRKAQGRERVHYGPLDVEDLGRVYEALLELEPGIATEPMCRLRRAKLEVVVPIAQGEKYRPEDQPLPPDLAEVVEGHDAGDETPKSKKKTKVEWIEAIRPGHFYLRVGLGRKASGSYYTPHSFVRFLVQETLGPQVEERSPQDDPDPAAILKLKVLDPAMGSGNFLVEACRFLGEHLYEACRLCDEKALAAERKAEAAADKDDEAAFATAEAETRKWRQRVIDLPDPDDELVRYLPSRSPEGEESGLSQKQAMALCRRLVAVHCLYGVDKNPLAVELAKLALWLESHAEGLPLTFLDHRLVVGDSLTGPFWDRLITKPSKAADRERLDDLFTQGLSRAFTDALAAALVHVRELEATVGATVAEIEAKRALKAGLDAALLPFKIIAAAWSGGVMLGPDHCDDHAYGQLVKAVCETGQLPAEIQSAAVCRMAAHGLGVDAIPTEGTALADLLACGVCIPALPYDLTFPEVFYPDGQPGKPAGFDAVVGNPPWEGIQPDITEFLGEYEAEALTKTNRAELRPIEERLLAVEAIRDRWLALEEALNGQKVATLVNGRLLHRLSSDTTSAAVVDEAMAFLDRTLQCCSACGNWGLVLPNGFHTNQSAAALRRHLIAGRRLKCVYGFLNQRRLFEISSAQRFDLVCGASDDTGKGFLVCFGFTDDAVLFEGLPSRSLLYEAPFIEGISPDYWTLPELSSPADLGVIAACYKSGKKFGEVLSSHRINPSEELHSSKQSARFVRTDSVFRDGTDPRFVSLHRLVASGVWPLHEKGTFDAFLDTCQDSPRFCVKLSTFQGQAEKLAPCQHFRLVHRAAIHASEPFKSVFTVLPPVVLVAHSAVVEKTPWLRPASQALGVCGVANSLPFNFVARQFVGLNMSKFVRDSLPWPKIASPAERFLAHSALRLLCNHAAFARLWQDSLVSEWREPKEPFTWPVLEGDGERWAVRTAIDAVVADAYGLSREQYEHVLSTFSHKSYPKAPELCLAAFDELQRLGLDAFTRKHDPYWDIPLNDSLPKPDPAVSAAIEKALAEANQDSGNPGGKTDLFGEEIRPKRRRKKH
jgi:hypothetical protein